MDRLTRFQKLVSANPCRGLISADGEGNRYPAPRPAAGNFVCSYSFSRHYDGARSITGNGVQFARLTGGLFANSRNPVPKDPTAISVHDFRNVPGWSETRVQALQ